MSWGKSKQGQLDEVPASKAGPATIPSNGQSPALMRTGLLPTETETQANKNTQPKPKH